MRFRRRAFCRLALLGMGATALCATSAALAPAASAHRAAATAEKSAMIYQASGRYYGKVDVAEPRSAPLTCFVADISTVSGVGRWGAWRFSTYAAGHPSQCHTADGTSIEHQIDGRWYVISQGSEGFPPTHKFRSGSNTYLGVPRPVAKDLYDGLR